jgi:hypothetical protein
MKYKHGFFQLAEKENGVYLRIYPPLAGGHQISLDDILFYLKQKKIENFDFDRLKEAVMHSKKPMELKLNDQVKNYGEDEYLQVMVSLDKKLAAGRFYPPSPTGKLMTKEDIINELNHAGVRHGIVEQMVDAYIKNRQFCVNIVLAKATLPVEGKSASIEYHFDTSLQAKPEIKEDGTVDFHQLNNIVHVEKGECLATLTPMEPGKDGIDVCGKPMHPKKVKNEVFRYGKNISISEDGLQIFSDVSGHASLTDGRVFVSNTYEVPADVGASTGDIEYDGNISIAGNVITGFRVKADGDIYVKGVVEGAELIAGGDIVLNRGIQGMERGYLKAGGNIVSKFIENSTVVAGGNVTTDAIMHSKVTAKGDVVAKGKRGLITGGEIHSGTMIEARVLGSTMGTHTALEVGIDPALVEEYHRLEKEFPDLEKELEKNVQTITMYSKKLQKGEKLSEDKMKALKAAGEKKGKLEKELEEKEERFGYLEEEMEHNNNGRVRIDSIAYPGVKVMISNVIYYVKTEIQRGQLVRDGADIRVKGF